MHEVSQSTRLEKKNFPLMCVLSFTSTLLQDRRPEYVSAVLEKLVSWEAVESRLTKAVVEEGSGRRSLAQQQVNTERSRPRVAPQERHGRTLSAAATTLTEHPRRPRRRSSSRPGSPRTGPKRRRRGPLPLAFVSLLLLATFSFLSSPCRSLGRQRPDPAASRPDLVEPRPDLALGAAAPPAGADPPVDCKA